MFFGLVDVSKAQSESRIIQLGDDVSTLSIGKNLRYFTDSTQSKYDILAVSDSAFDSRFVQSDESRLNFGFSDNAYWLKFTLSNNSIYDDWELEISYASLDYVDLYQQDYEGNWQSVKIGDRVEMSKRPVKFRHFIFPLNLTQKETKTYFVRVKTEGSTAIPITISRSAEVFQSQTGWELYYGIFYGLMLVMMIYNLFIYSSLRDYNYLLYSITIFFAVLYVSTLHGHTFQYLWGEYPAFQNQVHLFSIFGWMISILAFSISFLRIRKRAIKLYYYYLALIVVFVLSILAIPFSSYSMLIRFGSFMVLIVSLSVIGGGLHFASEGKKTAQFFVIAWTMYMIGNTIMALRAMGILPDNKFTGHALEIGAAMEVILISLALAERYKKIRQQKNVAESEAKRLLEQSNKELESKVFERTKELELQKEEVLTNNEELRQQQEEVSAQRDYIGLKNREMSKQKDKLEKAYMNVKILTEIGQKLTSLLDLTSIVEQTYGSVNRLMDASGFGIGVLDEDKKKIMFKGYMEKGEVLPTHFSEYNPERDLSSWCIERNAEILITDVYQDYEKYIQTQDIQSIEGDLPLSLIYLPLKVKGEMLGVITVQSFTKDAYTPEDVTILRSLGSYVSIAINNSETYYEVKNTRDELGSKNRRIMDSLRYAETIQHSILPTNETISKYVNDHFVLFSPKDVVSGDFYWFTRMAGKLFFAVVDCTGHGVPGAFMSLIGHDLLDTIVNQQNVLDPAGILELMNIGVITTFQQEKQLNSDGMDISLCSIETLESGEFKITYAGAKRPLFYIESGKFKKLKGTRKSVGGFQKKDGSSFQNEELILNKEDIIYLTSDGFVDQNSPSRKKYGTGKLKKQLISISSLNMEKQKSHLLEELSLHQQEEPQRDDITIMGIRL